MYRWYRKLYSHILPYRSNTASNLNKSKNLYNKRRKKRVNPEVSKVLTYLARNNRTVMKTMSRDQRFAGGKRRGSSDHTSRAMLIVNFQYCVKPRLQRNKTRPLEELSTLSMQRLDESSRNWSWLLSNRWRRKTEYLSLQDSLH